MTFKTHASSVARPPLGHPAFTLVEILVAMAVLLLVLILMLQVVDNIMRSTRVQNQQMDSVASARRALDLVDADLRTSVLSGDATILVPDGASSGSSETGPRLAFLARRAGPEGVAGHRFLSLAYATNAEGQLLRSYFSVPYSETNLLQIFPSPPDQVEAIAEGVLQWRLRAVTESGEKIRLENGAGASWATNRYNGLEVPADFRALVAPGPDWTTGLTNRTRALEVWVAAVDPQNFVLLESGGVGTSLAAQLSVSEPEEWRRLIDEAEVPSPVKSSARVLHKTIPLP